MTPMPGLEYLLTQIRRMRRRAVAIEWMTHLGWIITFASVAFIGIMLLASFTIPPSTVRLSLLIALGGGLAGILVWAVAKSTIWSPRDQRLALVVEERHPELKNRLIAALQLADRVRSNPENYSLELVDLTIRQATQMGQAIDFAASLDRARVKRAARWAGVGLGAVLLLSVMFPGLAQRSWEAYSSPLADFSPTIPYTMSVVPGSMEAVKFDDFSIEVRLEGQSLPRHCEIRFRSEGGDWQSSGSFAPVHSEIATARTTGEVRLFRYVRPQIKRDFEYYVTAGKLSSQTFTVKAVDRPRVTGLRVEVTPPPHTGLEPDVTDANDGAVTAPYGSNVRLSVESNRRLASTDLVFSDGRKVPLDVRGRTASTEFTVTKNTSYHLDLMDETDRTNPHPIEYAVTSIPDRDPSVEITWPGHNVDLTDNMAVDLKILARDDYGFTKMVLHTRWMSEGRERAVRTFDIPDCRVQGERLEQAYFWDLAEWGLMPDDVIHYYVEVTDNDRVTGPKTAQSNTYTVRLPSLDEMMAEFEQRWDEDLTALDKILAGEREMAQRVEELRREIAADQEIDWEQQKDLEELSSRAAELDQELDDIAENFEKQVAEAAQRKLASVEMMQKMMEAQQLFNEVATEEMREAQRKLQEALESMDPKEMERALNEMQISQEEMLQRLDRTIAYLKRLKAEQQLDAFVRQVEQMLAQQNALNEQADESQPEQLPNLSPPQDKLKSQFDELAAEMKDAKQELQDAHLAPPEMISQFCESPSQCSAPQQMQEASQQMQKQNKSGAQKSGEQAAADLSELLEEMKNLQSQMNQDQFAKTAEELRKSLDQVLYLSDEQEGMMTRANELDPSSLSLREIAAQQEALRQATQHVDQQLREIAKSSTCLSNSATQNLSQAMQEMQKSAQSLSERRGPQATRSQRESMFDLNQVAQQLVDGMDKNDKQCNNPGTGQCDNPGGQGAMAKMESLSQKQGRLNQQMPQGGGQGQSSMTQGEREALQRIKGEQAAIKRGVEDLHSEIGDEGNQIGRLDKLAEEMQKVIEDMEKNEVSEATRDRQRRIYARMLDFQHALKEQDYKDQRKARQVTHEPNGISPGTLDPTGGITDEEYERLLTRYQEEGYPPEYEETIKQYFRALVEKRGN